MSIQGLGAAASLYQATNRQTVPRQIQTPEAANSAEKVSVSDAARSLLANEARANPAPAAASALSSFDTDKGRVELDIDQYFSSTPANPAAELPPLLMPTQQNIDALSAHVSKAFPAFLAKNGIPEAPSSISFDSQGQPVFPADYPYAEKLRTALEETPGMARELSTLSALTEFKQVLDESVEFQSEYQRAANKRELDAVLAKYSSLLSGNAASPQATLGFHAGGQVAGISLS
ncbi:MAG: hypothetical protein CGU28_09705 [Candidatus Dactylopiibacterium carminicum]|nr:MAG: hypothetical protein CGU28_09705 [Candidatus Dactylopiibacterium carminicum]